MSIITPIEKDEYEEYNNLYGLDMIYYAGLCIHDSIYNSKINNNINIISKKYKNKIKYMIFYYNDLIKTNMIFHNMKIYIYNDEIIHKYFQLSNHNMQIQFDNRFNVEYDKCDNNFSFSYKNNIIYYKCNYITNKKICFDLMVIIYNDYYYQIKYIKIDGLLKYIKLNTHLFNTKKYIFNLHLYN